MISFPLLVFGQVDKRVSFGLVYLVIIDASVIAKPSVENDNVMMLSFMTLSFLAFGALLSIQKAFPVKNDVRLSRNQMALVCHSSFRQSC